MREEREGEREGQEGCKERDRDRRKRESESEIEKGNSSFIQKSVVDKE